MYGKRRPEAGYGRQQDSQLSSRQGMISDDPALGASFQLFKISTDQKTLNLVEALLMEMSICSLSSVQPSRTHQDSLNLMHGLLQVLEWGDRNEVSFEELSQLYAEWLKSKKVSISSHPLAYHYELLIQKNSLLESLRLKQLPATELQHKLGSYMEMLNSQLNVQLLNTLKTTQQHIDTAEDIYILLDEDGVGYIGMDQIMFLFMALIKGKHFPPSASKEQFYTEFTRFVSFIPNIYGRVPLRSIKTYLINNAPSIQELKQIEQSCLDLLQEFNWSASTETTSFPRPFNEAFVESMNWLHTEGLVSDSDIMRDEFLNVYNVFLNESFLKTVSMYSSDEQSCLGIGENSRIERQLFSSMREYYNERVLQNISMKPEFAVLQAFCYSFETRITAYVEQFVNRYSSRKSQDYPPNSQGTQNRSSKVFHKQSKTPSLNSSRISSKQSLGKENHYKPQLDFLEEHHTVEYPEYNSWKVNAEIGSCPEDTYSINRSTQPSQFNRSSVNYLESLQTNINKTIQSVQRPQESNSNSISQTQKQQLFKVFASQLPGQAETLKYSIILPENSRSSCQTDTSTHRQNNTNRNTNNLSRLSNLSDSVQIFSHNPKPPSKNVSKQTRPQSQQTTSNRTKDTYEQPQSSIRVPAQSISTIQNDSINRKTTKNNNIKPHTISQELLVEDDEANHQKQQIPVNSKYLPPTPPPISQRSKATQSQQSRRLSQHQPPPAAASVNKKSNSQLAQSRANSPISINREQKTPEKRSASPNTSGIIKSSNNQGSSKSPKLIKRPSSQQSQQPQHHKCIESFEKVMERLTQQGGISPLKATKKKSYL